MSIKTAINGALGLTEIESRLAQLEIKSEATASAVAAITPNKWAGKAWGIDVYDPAVLNLPVGSVDFVGLRIGGTSAREIYINPNFGVQVQAVWDAGAVPIAYWIVHPDYYPNKEFTADSFAKMTDDKHEVLLTIKSQLRSGNTAWKKVGGLFYDCEIAGNPVWEAMYVDDLRGRIRNQQSKGEFPKLLQGGYSRASWINGRPPIKTLFENQPGMMIWTANYMTSFPGKFSAIAEKRTAELPMATQNPIWFGDNPAKPKELPRIWQYHGTFNGAQYSTCPEVTANGKPMGLDLNVMECTRAELFEAVGWADPLLGPPPPPVDPPPVEPPSDLAARVQALEDWQARVRA